MRGGLETARDESSASPKGPRPKTTRKPMAFAATGLSFDFPSPAPWSPPALVVVEGLRAEVIARASSLDATHADERTNNKEV
ncbi:hypothetical protein B296_00026800 [Ensete ventricosum]|uniref:Uncharacterized protein n=1 Tax=Ensete ventricosum TaxID=4639 RepID=A0A426ZUR9_ENSVE|nr:hypothetical protein B296_00026800 [Ensete ventricosum]